MLLAAVRGQATATWSGSQGLRAHQLLDLVQPATESSS
jgi:hypothetical protein